MRVILLGTLAILLACPGRGSGADPTPPAPAGAGPAADTGKVSAPPEPVPAETTDTHPWNPSVLHGNDWPYDKPLRIASDFYGPPGEFWLRAEYYLWGIKGDRLPPLVTSGPAGSGAVPGQSGVGVLFGGSRLDPDPFSGGRFAAGLWLDNCYTVAFEGSYFFLGEQAVRFATASSGRAGSPDLARPFLNVVTGQPASSLVASPGLASGYVNVQQPTSLQGAEATLVWNVERRRTVSYDLVAGFRYLEMRESLNVLAGTTALAGAPFPGTSSVVADEFSAHNHFYGGQIGGRVEYRWRSLVFDLTEKLGLGANTADVAIAGTSVQTLPTGTVTQTAGGLLAQPTNNGGYSDDTFAVVNEVGVQAGWQIHDYVQVFVGYTLLYDSSVVRPGELVDLGVNPTREASGPARPAFGRRETAFWAQGLNVGVEVRY